MNKQVIFERVQASFLNELSGRVAEIHQAWEDVRSGSIPPVPESGVPEIVRLVHNLAGAASTFKLDELSQRCRYLEKLLLNWFKQKDYTADEAFGEIETGLQSLEEFQNTITSTM